MTDTYTMPIFKPDRPNPVLKGILNWALSSLITSALIVIASIFIKTVFNESFYYIMGALFFMYLLDDIRKDRYSEINIDTDKKQLIFSSKSFFSERKQNILPFENAAVEIRTARANKFLLRKASMTLYFLKNKMEVCELNNTKDGFSLETLNAICKSLEEIALPAKTV